MGRPRSDLLTELEEYKDSIDGMEYSLRLDLVDSILEYMRDKNIPQSKFAEAMGKKPPQLSRIMHAVDNCTLRTVAEVFHVLGIRPQITKRSSEYQSTTRAESATVANPIAVIGKGTIHGHETNKAVIWYTHG